MTVISIALLHAERCSAKVATPSDTVNDKEFIRLPSCSALTPNLRNSLTYLLTYLSDPLGASHALDHAPYPFSPQQHAG
jgi:hypothetical protein